VEHHKGALNRFEKRTRETILNKRGNYGIFQKTPENNNCDNRIYFHSLDIGDNDASGICKIGKKWKEKDLL
jgi:hypothetical protein